MTLDSFNALPPADAQSELFACCGSQAWVERVARLRPFESLIKLYSAADREWGALTPGDWVEAFAHHPRIGDLSTLRSKWTAQEQGGVTSAGEAVLHGLLDGNRAYEKRFGHIFLICATGKSADEMLAALRERLRNEPGVELAIAAGEQAKITRIRLEKLFAEEARK